MKRSLWIASSIAVLALPAGAVMTRAIAGGNSAEAQNLQATIGAGSVIDLTANRAVCHRCDKDGSCRPVCGGILCGPCTH